MLKDVADAEISKLVRRVNAERQPDEDLICLNQLLDDVHFIRKNKYYFLDRSEISPGAAVLVMTLPEEMFPTSTVIGVGGAAELIRPQASALVASISELIRDHLLAEREGEAKAIS